ncbi:MAG: DUF1810 domain-containing protein [Solobacterium sp.]|nr:DUF1810 domain-containing protein [Solobacterium sp.]
MSLDRYLEAQEHTYQIALAELRSGRKQSHWMWYIFPQLYGLGFSPTSRYYAIQSFEEVRDYLNHPVLSQRLNEITDVLLQLNTTSAIDVFGSVDAMKLNSSLTLFALLSEPGSRFHKALEKYFDGVYCEYTRREFENVGSR